VAFDDGVTSAAIGSTAGACVVPDRRTIFENDWDLQIPEIILSLITVGLLLKFKKLS